MHPLLSHLRGLAAYLLTWALAATVLAGMVAWRGLATWPFALLWTLPLIVVFAFLALSVYYLCRALPFGAARWTAALAGRLCAVVLLSAAMLALAWVWNSLGVLADHPTGWVALSPAATLLATAACTTVLLLSVLAHDLLIAFQNTREAAEREAQARLLAREMELQVLRTQVDPHFLFNCLNSISALTTLDAPAARAMSIDLAQFLRQTLALADRSRISLAEELRLVGHFLAVETHRLGDRLHSQIDADATSRNALLPPLTLQPLVENALKHGLRSRDDGGWLRVQAQVRDGWLHLAVRNPVDEGADPSVAGLGMGLRNLRERLALQYGARARIHWAHGPAGFTVEITLPFESSP